VQLKHLQLIRAEACALYERDHRDVLNNTKGAPSRYGSPQSQVESQSDGAFTKLNPQKQTILIVDDEPEIRKLVSAMLVKAGYRVLSADTGENAIRMFKSNPDTTLLLTDVVAPGMSGPMIADQIAALNPAIKVLFMSGYDGTQVVQKYVVDKGYSLLIKPFTVEQLEHKVKAVLSKTGTP
jgi:two-component system cell cycle sensor histidine kinase/response regulator CckA